jgi:septal ring factor EnvC (AmiA/AmiB activator)
MLKVSHPAQAGQGEGMEHTEPQSTDGRAQLHQQYRNQISQYKSANAELADIAWTLSELEQQISALEADLAQEHTPHLARRISDLRRWRGALEETVIRHMYRTEELLAEVDQLRAALAENDISES